MNYTWCIPLYKKEVDEVMHAYLVYVYLKKEFSESRKVLLVDGTELKNKLFSQVASILGIKQIHSSAYNPEAMVATKM